MVPQWGGGGGGGTCESLRLPLSSNQWTSVFSFYLILDNFYRDFYEAYVNLVAV